MIAGGVAALLISVSGGLAISSNADAVYAKKVAAAFGPVLGANQQVSDALAAVRGTDPADAKGGRRPLAARDDGRRPARSARSARRPARPRWPAEARQVLDREAAYLAAVSAVINHPSVAGAGPLQTLRVEPHQRAGLGRSDGRRDRADRHRRRPPDRLGAFDQPHAQPATPPPRGARPPPRTPRPRRTRTVVVEPVQQRRELRQRRLRRAEDLVRVRAQRPPRLPGRPAAPRRSAPTVPPRAGRTRCTAPVPAAA